MTQDNFSQRKKDVLLKKDKSSKQSIDEKIKKLCDKINKLKDCYTTSSCSGRIIVMIDEEKKVSNLFIKCFHDKVSFSDVKKVAEANKKIKIKFKTEPCIIHIACKDLAIADKIYSKAKLAGWKKSGLISWKKNIVLEISGTGKLEFPLTSKGKLLVNDDLLKKAVKIANSKLEKSWTIISRLEKEI